MRSLCLLCVATLLAVASLPAQEMTEEITETFGATDAGAFATRWETVGGNWLVRDGALHGESASRRAFAYLADMPESPHLQAMARLRVGGRDGQQGWCVAGVTVYLGATDFWQLALVEDPDGKRYVELVEMLAGTWQAQRAEGTALRPVDNEGQWTGWDHRKDYLLTLSLSPQMVSGKVSDAESGALLTHLSYAWDGLPGVRSGKPGFLTSGLRLEATGLTVRWALPAVALRGLAVETGVHGSLALLADAAAGIDEADAGIVGNALRQGGFGVTPATCADLATLGFLDPSRFAGLVLANSRRFPVAAEACLRRFMRGGRGPRPDGGHAVFRTFAQGGRRVVDPGRGRGQTGRHPAHAAPLRLRDRDCRTVATRLQPPRASQPGQHRRGAGGQGPAA